MAEITVEAVEYPVTRCQEVGEVLEGQRATQAGNLRSALQGTDARGRVWDCEFSPLTDAQFSTLEALVIAPGSLTLGGDQVGSPSVECIAVPGETNIGPVADYVTFPVQFFEIGSV